MTSHFNQPIFWHQGLFLQPHHLQYQDLKNRSELYKTLALVTPWPWGVASMAVRQASLENEQLLFDELSVLWPDGTFTDIGTNAIIESALIPIAQITSAPKTLYLGLRQLLPNNDNVGVFESLSDAVSTHYRHVITADPQNIPDYYSGNTDGQGSLMTYVLRLFWEDEIDELSTYDVMPIAQVGLDGETINVNQYFIPPCLSLGAAPQLESQLHNLIEGLAARARQLEIFKRPMRAIGHQTNSEQVYSVLALSILNRFASELTSLLSNKMTPPSVIHATLKNLVAELSTFSEHCNYSGETPDGKGLQANYQHRNIADSFSPLFRMIRLLLDDITLGPEMLVKFKRSDHNPDMFDADLPMNFFGVNHEYYLIVRQAHRLEGFIEKIEREAKLDEQHVIHDLIRKYLPGLPLQYLEELPVGLPRRTNSEYFCVRTEEKEWNSLIRRRDISLFIPDAPDDISIDMIVLKR